MSYLFRSLVYVCLTGCPHLPVFFILQQDASRGKVKTVILKNWFQEHFGMSTDQITQIDRQVKWWWNNIVSKTDFKHFCPKISACRNGQDRKAWFWRNHIFSLSIIGITDIVIGGLLSLQPNFNNCPIHRLLLSQ